MAGPGDTNLGVGIDIEPIRSISPAFEEMCFVAEELEFLRSLPVPQKEEWAMRFWCAKEAVAKCLGRGLMDGPLGVTVQTWNSDTGTVSVTLRGLLADEFPEFVESGIAVYTAREGEYIIASTLWNEEPIQ